VAESNIRLKVDGRDAVQQLNRVNKAAGTLQGTVGKLVGAFAGIQAAKFVFFKTAELERQTKSLQVLTGSLGNARNIIKELQQFGAVTPFTSSELIETAKRLKAFGFETEQVVDVTKRLADVAGATGADLGGIATAFGQIQAKGRLQGEELLQLQERGVGLQDELRKMYKLTADDFRKALEGGRISADAVNVALKNITETGGKYAGGAIAQSDTLAGKFSTLIDGVENISRTIGEVLSPALKGVLGIAIDVVNSINAAFNAQKRLSGFGIDDQQRNKLFRQAGEEAQQLALLRGGGKVDSSEFTKIRQQRFSDLINQFGFDTGQLIPEIGVPQSDTKLPELLTRTAKTGKGKAENLVEQQLKAGAKLSQQFTRQIKLREASSEIARKELRIDFERQDALAEIAATAEIGQQAGLEELANKVAILDTEKAREELALEKQKREQEREKKAAEAAQRLIEADPGFQMRAQFEELIKLENQVAAGATAIGGAFSNAFIGVISGAKSAQQGLAEMMQSVAKHFLDMATKIIAQQLAMILYGTIMKALGVSMPGGGGGFNPFAPSITGNSIGDFGGGHFAGFANGGRPPVGRPSIVGERGPELFVPGTSGTIIPNHALGGGANVTVNVDASGSSVEGDSDQASQLGKMLGAAVQAELIKQKRPGGLLSS
jgi:tape measure domain-containing protein